MRAPACAPRLAALAGLLTLAGPAGAAEIHVMISGGFSAAYQELVPEFERTSGHTVVTVKGPSMGETPEAIPKRLERGESADVLIVAGPALDGLAKSGRLVAGTRVDLAWSGIGMVVRAGTPHPDIGSIDALKATLLAAKSIAYSDSASGVYLSAVLFPRLGIAEQLRRKSQVVPGEPVAAVVARGGAEIGFQQVSELKPIAGVELVGLLPGEAQKLTVFSGAVASRARAPEAAQELLRFLTSPAAAPVITASGMEPAGPRRSAREPAPAATGRN